MTVLTSLGLSLCVPQSRILFANEVVGSVVGFFMTISMPLILEFLYQNVLDQDDWQYAQGRLSDLACYEEVSAATADDRSPWRVSELIMSLVVWCTDRQHLQVGAGSSDGPAEEGAGEESPGPEVMSTAEQIGRRQGSLAGGPWPGHDDFGLVRLSCPS